MTFSSAHFGNPAMGKRPPHMKTPRLPPSPPVPRPDPIEAGPKIREDDRNPTRYGDWEKNGIAVDF